MEPLTTTEVRDRIDEMVDAVNADPHGTGYTITRDGAPAAVLIDYGEFDRLCGLAAITLIR